MTMTHDHLHAQFDRAGCILEGVAKLKERIAELENENKELKEALERQKDAYLKLDDMYQRDTGIVCKAMNPGVHCAEMKKVMAENESLKYSVATLETDLAMSQRWRKVSEELPEVGQEVIFLAKYKTGRIRKWLGDYRSLGGNNCVFYTSCPGWGCEFLPSEIIGWMPLPKAPEEK